MMDLIPLVVAALALARGMFLSRELRRLREQMHQQAMSIGTLAKVVEKLMVAR